MRTFETLAAGSIAFGSAHGEVCAACDVAFVTGDITSLIPLGPGLNEEERKKALVGEEYVAVCAVVHASCADPRLAAD